MLLSRIPTRPNPVTVLPEPLAALGKLAANFYWAWHPEAHALFTKLDSWRGDSVVGPVQLLATARNLNQLAEDQAFLKDLKAVETAFDAYLAEPLKPYGNLTPERPAAYFCAEYGLHESFAQYCGGLGILAGDHCKEASDMRLPFVASGCFYRLGFFRQSLEVDGRQSHVTPEFDPAYYPLERVLDPKTGEPLTLAFPFPGRTVQVAVWRVAVGRVPQLLLDTDLPENDPADRPITAQLYMTSREMRFHQEMLLGMAGVRVLRALGIDPWVYHMNEGHSALLLVERLLEQLKAGASWKEAQRTIKDRSILTIHTPVPAGNERFDAKLVKELMEPSLEGTDLKVSALLKLGLDSVSDPKVFDMTAFALRLSRQANGVSLLHGQTADKTWRKVVGMPVGAVTNGVHLATWLGPQVRAAYEKVGAKIAPETLLELENREGLRPSWEGVENLSDAEFWEAHCAQKRFLAEFGTARLLKQHTKYGEGPSELRALRQMLNPEAFWIGFARRMTPYKRAHLLLSDLKRAVKMLSDTDRPVQILFSGKAHYLDLDGQAMLAEIYQLTQDPKLKGKVFLLEEYDMATGRALVQGVDLWVNNPLRPLEASGTSGMKAAANGVPNCSILDGWWDEGFEPGMEIPNGFQVGSRTPRKSREKQDKFDAKSLYEVLEREVLPLYWKRDEGGVPTGWVKVMKRAAASSLYAFSTLRMLEDYARTMYQ